jgi:hypothetical protein
VLTSYRETSYSASGIPLWMQYPTYRESNHWMT